MLKSGQAAERRKKAEEKIDVVYQQEKRETKSISDDEREVIKLYTFSPYRKKTKRNALLLFKGTVKESSISACTILVDSGCEEVVISKKYANKLKLMRKKTNLNAELCDGTQVPMGMSSKILTLSIWDATFKIRPYVVDIITYDIILGKSWLSDVNPIID